MINSVSINDLDRFNELGLELNNNFVNLFKLEDILSNSYSQVIGYYDNDNLVAFLHIDKSYEVVDIVNIVVDDNYKRQGIATKLLSYVFEELKDVDKYLLEVKITNESAIKLYEKNGFKVINTRKGYYNGIDAYVMERDV